MLEHSPFSGLRIYCVRDHSCNVPSVLFIWRITVCEPSKKWAHYSIAGLRVQARSPCEVRLITHLCDANVHLVGIDADSDVTGLSQQEAQPYLQSRSCPQLKNEKTHRAMSCHVTSPSSLGCTVIVVRAAAWSVPVFTNCLHVQHSWARRQPVNRPIFAGFRLSAVLGIPVLRWLMHE